MKKFIIGIVLLGALVTVVYVQLLRQDEHQLQAEQLGFQSGLAEAQGEEDSLANLLTQRTVRIDSLTSLTTDQTEYSDSLLSVIDSQGQEIATLKSSTKKSSSEAAVPKAKDGPGDKEILEYYKSRVSKLPGDLSSYEKRVALSEIRQETAEKYRITESQLNSIRKKHKLNY